MSKINIHNVNKIFFNPIQVKSKKGLLLKREIYDKTYTSKAITLKPEDIVAKDKSGNVISNENYVIVEDSYKNNINAGTASVTIKGKTNYVGTKEVKFKIKQQGMTWWERLWATT